MNKKLYVVTYCWYSDNSGAICGTNIFDTYNKALKYFNDKIEDEELCSDYWSYNAFDADGKVKTDDYLLITNCNTTKGKVPLYWCLEELGKLYHKDMFKLEIQEIEI